MKNFLLTFLIVMFFLNSGFLCTGAQEIDYLSMDMDWNKIIEDAKAEGSLTFYSWWGEQYWKEIAQKFEQDYGISVRVVMADHAAKTSKAVAEKNREVGTMDVMHIGGEEVKIFIEGELLYGPILDVIPNADKLDPELSKIQEGIPTKGYLVPVYRNQTGFLYDPQRVSDPPQTWDELESWIKNNPKQFAFSDPSKGGSGQAFVQTAIENLCGGLEKYAGDEEFIESKVANWNLAWEWFNENENDMVITVSNYSSIDRLNQGEVSLIVAWDDETQINLNKGTLFERATLYIPEMGLPGGGDSVGILKNAPHKAASLLFIAYLIEEDNQLFMNEIIGSYLARTDISTHNALLTEQERKENKTSWVPAQYKDHYIKEFVDQVLMR
jgi:putative spermidine/putrescine transport system substrate-binding protein